MRRTRLRLCHRLPRARAQTPAGANHATASATESGSKIETETLSLTGAGQSGGQVGTKVMRSAPTSDREIVAKGVEMVSPDAWLLVCEDYYGSE